MRGIISILFTGVFLMSGMQISLDRHYCCGELADVRISLTGKLASCGMVNEAQNRDVPFQPLLKHRCCEDEMTHLALNDKFYPEQSDFNFSQQSTNIQLTATPINFNITETCRSHFAMVLPPGKIPVFQPELSAICNFRI